MIYTLPDYYKEFQCIADRCEDTCCAGWQIVIDEKSLNGYKKIILGKKEGVPAISRAFRKRLLGSVLWHEEVFKQDSKKRCAFLNENNLCDLYTNCGEHSLCKTCKQYPRHIEEFEGVREITLSISCPEVARILLNKKEPVEFVSYEREGEEEYEDFDPFFYSILEDARTEMLAILQNRSLDIPTRVLLVLGMAHDMQGRINGQEMFGCMDVIDKYCKESAVAFARNYAKQSAGMVRWQLAQHLFDKQYELELLREEWDMLLQEAEVLLYSNGCDYYKEISTEFADWESGCEMDIILEQLLVYFLFTYFPGAVYDGCVYAKVQMAVYLTWMIYELFMARWIKNGKTLQKEEMIDLTYCFSREVEHSDMNLKQVDKWMEKKIFLNKKKALSTDEWDKSHKK